jgi:uncharacterized cupin superfamily protein
MPDEAQLEQTENGAVPKGEGWYVVNARESRWWHHDAFGSAVTFEGDSRFKDFGINVQVLQPGEPNCMYHGENAQEDFLVLSGECLLLVEGEERPLKQWDFFHAPPWTEHAFVGAGDGPCVILMAGARTGPEVRYPFSELAARYGASVRATTEDPQEAYAGMEWFRRERPPDWARLPWA